MTIYFVQHGLALEKEQDAERPLSTEGRESINCIAGHLQKMGITINKICHSGKTRAKETAQIFADYIGDGQLSELSGMNPNDDVTAFAGNLQDDDTMYVGHLPQMDKLVSYLITGDENTRVVKFTNGGVVCIGKETTGFHIDWYLQPSMCHR